MLVQYHFTIVLVNHKGNFTTSAFRKQWIKKRC